MTAIQKELPLLITKSKDQIDSVIANAIKVMIDSTPFTVDYHKEERDVYVRNWFRETISHREIEVTIKIKLPIE